LFHRRNICVDAEWIAELFWRFFADALTASRTGYESHLVLDGCTPMELPLLGL
jgi:hypothetical protein